MTSAEHMPAAASAQPVAAATAGARRLDPLEVGWQFVQEYYTILNKEPGRLHCFYNKNSVMLHGIEGESVDKCVGQQEIHKRFVELDFHKSKVIISNVDSQDSLAGGIMVCVLGELETGSLPARKFAQTFLLAEQPNGYYVHNDIFRFLKEELEECADAPASEVISEAPIEPEAPQASVNEMSYVVSGHAPVSRPVPTEKVAAAPMHDAQRTMNGGWGQAVPISPPKPAMSSAAPVNNEPIAKPPQAPSKPAAPVASDERKQPTVASAVVAKSASPVAPKQSAAPSPASSTNVSPPKTWASLADNGKERWSSHAAPEVKAAVMPAADHADEERPRTKPARQNSRYNDGGNNGNTSTRHHSDRNASAVFIRGFGKNTKITAIKEDFAAVLGEVRWVELLSDNTALIQFADVANVGKALQLGKTTVNGETVYIEDKEKAGVRPPRTHRPATSRPQSGGQSKYAGSGSRASPSNGPKSSSKPAGTAKQ